ncbi:MAG: hypothetical protein ACO3FI_13005, partial [Cyclobacteriaceae bacterium]
MKKQILFTVLLSLCIFFIQAQQPELAYPGERHLKNIRQLTFGGDNAEAYWSFDGRMVSFQSNNKAWGVQCDQIFFTPVDAQTNLKEEKPKMVSTGKGRSTCAYFMPGDKRILFGSTHLGGDACPAEPERVPGGKYLWPIYDTYDIFVSDLNGK